MKYRTFSEIKTALNEGKTVSEILNYYIQNINERKALNAFLEVFETSAIAKAKEVDEKLKNGTAGRLAGMIIGIKDNICYKDHKVSSGSKMLGNFVSVYSATVVEKLLQEDAVIIGRLNCDEFSMGSSNKNSAFGPVKNPLNEEYVPGGSSGGPAAAVAGNLCTVALGSDTGGSIRQPASFTGTLGFKPTYGRVSRYGLIAYASSLDQIGPIANDLNDTALVYEVISGADEYDSTLTSKEIETFIPKTINNKLKIAVFCDSLDEIPLDKEIINKIQVLKKELESKGHETHNISFTYLDQLIPVYYILSMAEASSNLARFDGIRFGHRSTEAKDLEEMYIKSRTEGFGQEVKHRIMAGALMVTKDNYSNYYEKALKIRRLIKNEIDKFLNEYDFILSPATFSTAFKIEDKVDAIPMRLQDLFLVSANLAGNPAVSLPLGQHSNGMPFGLQLIGKSFEENELLNFSNYLLDFN